MIRPVHTSNSTTQPFPPPDPMFRCMFRKWRSGCRHTTAQAETKQAVLETAACLVPVQVSTVGWENLNVSRAHHLLVLGHGLRCLLGCRELDKRDATRPAVVHHDQHTAWQGVHRLSKGSASGSSIKARVQRSSRHGHMKVHDADRPATVLLRVRSCALTNMERHRCMRVALGSELDGSQPASTHTCKDAKQAERAQQPTILPPNPVLPPQTTPVARNTVVARTIRAQCCILKS